MAVVGFLGGILASLVIASCDYTDSTRLRFCTWLYLFHLFICRENFTSREKIFKKNVSWCFCDRKVLNLVRVCLFLTERQGQPEHRGFKGLNSETNQTAWFYKSFSPLFKIISKICCPGRGAEAKGWDLSWFKSKSSWRSFIKCTTLCSLLFLSEHTKTFLTSLVIVVLDFFNQSIILMMTTSYCFHPQLLIIFPAIHYVFSFYVLGYWKAYKNGGCA